MVGTCVSTVGVAISDVVLTRAGGVQRRLESSLSWDVGTLELTRQRNVELDASILRWLNRGILLYVTSIIDGGSGGSSAVKPQIRLD